MFSKKDCAPCDLHSLPVLGCLFLGCPSGTAIVIHQHRERSAWSSQPAHNARRHVCTAQLLGCLTYVLSGWFVSFLIQDFIVEHKLCRTATGKKVATKVDR
eukprot:m.199729 g.199729  ORF g.199729 m.199729 type:complete len:101 (-) comp25178_c0_seq1:1283-1585(-)